MINTHTILSNLKRPKILISAARLGMANYDRDADLRFIVKTQNTPNHGAAIETLLTREQELEVRRKDEQTSYSVQEHIRVLTALLAEVRFPSFARKQIAP
ncbi:MAG: DUF6477 family protein [Amylibacter sp.]